MTRPMLRLAVLVLSAMLTVLIPTREAHAQPAPAAASEAEKLARAKALFKEGNALRNAGDCAGALEKYAASRALVPSAPNTLNAAYCLDKLGRYDEALELYEVLVAKHNAELSPQNREAIAPEMARLRQQLGSLEISANVAGSLTIDGRPRGDLPKLTAVRVLPGRRLVMVSKEGYRTFEQTIDVRAGQTLQLKATLEHLTVVGRAAIQDAALAGAEVFIDGARVGVVPWEGQLEPGSHFFHLQRGEVGSAPAAFSVVKGQTVSLAAQLVPLGPEVNLSASPLTATLSINRVVVGKGRFVARLPIGRHHVVAQEEGYFDAGRMIDVTPTPLEDITIRLAADESHARWGVTSGAFLVDALGGLAIAPAFGSGAENSCDGAAACTSNPAGLGFFVGARGAYEFPFRMSVELAGGYLRAGKTIERTTTRADTRPEARGDIAYALQDSLRISGPFGVAGLGYRLPFARMFELRGHLLAGALYAFARDDMSATAARGGETTSTRIRGNDTATGAPVVLVMPSAEVGLRFDGFGVGLGVSALIVALEGPPQQNGEIAVDGSEGCAAGDLNCVSNYDGVAGERGFGPFVLITPTLSAGYVF